MNIIKFPSPSVTNIWILLFLILSVLYSFSGIFFGLDFTDSFYHLNQALNPPDGIYLYPFFLSSVIIKGLIEVVGTNIFNLRIINWLLLVISMVIPFLFLKVEGNRSKIALYFALVLILYAPLNANILGYDTFSVFINSLLFSVLVLYFRTGNIYLILALSIISAAAILIRLPNGLAVPIIFCFLWIIDILRRKKWRLKGIILPATFVLFTCFLTFTGYKLQYNNWQQFIVSNSNQESHDLSYLFLNYLKDGFKIGGFVILILLGRFSYKKLWFHGYPMIKDCIFILFFIFCLLFLIHSRYSINYALFLVAFTIAIGIVQTYSTPHSKCSEKQLILYLFLIFLFINPFGSNTGLLKAYSLLLLLPFILSNLKLNNKKYYALLVIVLIPFSVFTRIFGIYEDKNLIYLDTKLSHDKLSPILTNSVREKFITETNFTVHELQEQGFSIFFYGDKTHIFSYLYPETFFISSAFNQPVDDRGLIEGFNKALQGKDEVAVFIVNSYPENSHYSVSLIEEEMLVNGFEKVEEDSLRYYLRSKNIN